VRAHKGAVTGVAQMDNGSLVTVGNDKCIKIWNRSEMCKCALF